MDDAAAGSTTFAFLGGSIEQSATDFVLPVLAAVCAWLKIVLVPLAGIYLVCLLLSWMLGRASLGAAVVAALRIAVLAALVTSTDLFGVYVLDVWKALEADLAGVFGFSADGGIYATLDASINRAVEIAQLCFSLSSSNGRFAFDTIVPWMLCGLMVSLGGALLAAVGGAIIIGAKLVLMLGFASGPIFVAAAIFPPTQRFLDAWIAQKFAQILKVVMVGAALVLAMALLGALIDHASFDPKVSPWGTTVAIFIVLVVLGILLANVSSYAAGLSGGMSLADARIGHFLAPPKIALGGAKAALGGSSTRRDVSTGHLVNGSRAGHFLAGNTVANPRYAQARMSSIGKNWGMWNGGSVSPGGTPKP